MSELLSVKSRVYFTGMVAIAIWSLLAWSYYHGGVPSHHILADESLPSFSNWWGGILLPLVTWFLLYRIHKRIIRRHTTNSSSGSDLNPIFYGFAGALLFEVLLSVFFTLSYINMAGYLMMSILPFALFLPIYRAECLLGFVIGMTFTFGGVLPIGVGSIVLAISAVLYLLVRPGILYVASRMMRVAPLNK